MKPSNDSALVAGLEMMTIW